MLLTNDHRYVIICVQLVLAELSGHEFQLTLHVTQRVSDVVSRSDAGDVYAFETSSSCDDDLVDIIALSCDARKARRSVVRTFYIECIAYVFVGGERGSTVGLFSVRCQTPWYDA